MALIAFSSTTIRSAEPACWQPIRPDANSVFGNPEPATAGEMLSKAATFTGLMQSELFAVEPSKLKPLRALFQRMIQGPCNEDIQRAMKKPAGYLWRFFSSESWSEWTEQRTQLGKVVYACEQYVRRDCLPVLNRSTVEQAISEAERLLNLLSQSEELPSDLEDGVDGDADFSGDPYSDLDVCEASENNLRVGFEIITVNEEGTITTRLEDGTDFCSRARACGLARESQSVALAPNAKAILPLMQHLLQRIAGNLEPGKSLDIVLVLDSTMMRSSIESIAADFRLSQYGQGAHDFISELKRLKDTRFAIVQAGRGTMWDSIRDPQAEVIMNFTDDHGRIVEHGSSLSCRNYRESGLTDAFTQLANLSWRQEASQIVLLVANYLSFIGDNDDSNQIVDESQGRAIYPIFVID